MKRFIIREAELYEFKDVRRFYEEFAHEKVAERPQDVIRQTIEDGSLIVAIDTSLNESERIFGCSAAYTLEASLESGGSVTLKEAGSTLIRESHRSFGIHKVFHWARSLHEHILDRGGFDTYFSSIRCPNERSERSMARVGFEVWDNPPKSIREKKERNFVAKAGEYLQFYRLPRHVLREHARELLTIEHDRHVARIIDGKDEIVELHFALQLTERYRHILQDIVDNGVETALDV